MGRKTTREEDPFPTKGYGLVGWAELGKEMGCGGGGEERGKVGQREKRAHEKRGKGFYFLFLF
jgi:hypothetical protein